MSQKPLAIMKDNGTAATPPAKVTAVKRASVELAKRMDISPAAFMDWLNYSLVKAKNGRDISPQEMLKYLVVCNEHQLNPFLDEIEALKDRDGNLIPYVKGLGWVKIVNRQTTFDGYEFEYLKEGSEVVGMIGKLYDKRWNHAFSIPVYLDEVFKGSRSGKGPWDTQTRHMLFIRTYARTVKWGYGVALHTEDEAHEIAGPEAVKVDFDVTPTPAEDEGTMKDPDFHVKDEAAAQPQGPPSCFDMRDADGQSMPGDPAACRGCEYAKTCPSFDGARVGTNAAEAPQTPPAASDESSDKAVEKPSIDAGTGPEVAANDISGLKEQIQLAGGKIGVEKATIIVKGIAEKHGLKGQNFRRWRNYDTLLELYNAINTVVLDAQPEAPAAEPEAGETEEAELCAECGFVLGKRRLHSPARGAWFCSLACMEKENTRTSDREPETPMLPGMADSKPEPEGRAATIESIEALAVKDDFKFTNILSIVATGLTLKEDAWKTWSLPNLDILYERLCAVHKLDPAGPGGVTNTF